MSTTLLNCQILLSQDIGDYWEGTTTSSTGSVTVTDIALTEFANDWANTDIAYDFITSAGSNQYEERAISSLDNSTGALTLTRGHTASVGSGTFYQVHRLFKPTEKRRALVAAAQNSFGDLYDEVWNEEIVSGNWFIDGSFERWLNSGSLTNWLNDAITPSQVSTNGLFKHGSVSVLLAGTAGTLSQGYTQNDDLKRLAGKHVTFSAQGHCNTASCLRLAITDGTTETFSNYHAGGTSWTQDDPRNDNFYVEAFIDYNPTEVTFKIVHENANGTSYVDDARLICGEQHRQYIGHLGLAQNRPNMVYVEPTYYSYDEPWDEIHDWEVDENGYLYLPTSTMYDRRMRIVGKQYVDFRLTGTSSTAWNSSINLDEPQTRILSAEAAVWLYTWMSMPNFESGIREEYQGMLSFWRDEAKRRKGRHGMPIMPVTTSWGME